MILFMLIIILLIIHYSRIKNTERFANTGRFENTERFANIEKTIFISVPSYRDSECPNTITSIFENAKNPDNVFIGIFQQNSSSDPDCFNSKYKNNIKIIRVSDIDAKGPTHARAKVQELTNNEDFFISIDSHTRFVPNWDVKLIFPL